MNVLPIICLSIALVLFALVVRTLASKKRPDRTSKQAQRSSSDGYEAFERARMPEEIKDAKLVVSEKTFFRPGSRPFAAKTDQGFLTRDGWLVLVETKTRIWISESDLVQISAQAVAIASQRNCKWKVANWGYIRLAPPGRAPYYKRVQLLHPTRIDQLWDRWKALKDRRVIPIARPAAYRCRTCTKRHSCPVAIRG